MPARLTVLASGSSGNASLLQVDGFGLLVDCGLPPQVLADRLAAVGASWADVRLVALTHTHGDHWNRHTLAHLRRLAVPLLAHPRHHAALAARAEHDPLRRAGLTPGYQAGVRTALTADVGLTPVPVPHDADPTFAFRIDAGPGADGWAVGFASDLGRGTDELAAALAGADVLAVEFNHDVRMQQASRRPRLLIDRVLGDRGHLSNAQAADLTRRLVAAAPGRLRAVVQLHLSRECNTPQLAAAAGRAAVGGAAVVVTASQHRPTAPIPLAPRPPVAPPRRRSVQLTLPGLADPADR